MSDVTSQVSKEIRSEFAKNMSEVRLEPYLRIGFRTGNLEITVLFLDLLFSCLTLGELLKLKG